MRKISLLAVLAIVLATTFSCKKSGKANLKTDVDTISYAIGLLNGGQLQQFLEQQGMDSTCVSDFMKGFKEGANNIGDKKKQAYYMGLMQGMQMTEGLNKEIFGGDDGDEKISVPKFMAGLKAGLKKDTSVFKPEVIQGKLEGMVNSAHKKAMDKKYKEEKEKGAKFLAEKAKDPNVKKLANGVLYKVIKEGNGPVPNDSTANKVKINYEGKLIDGTKFDSSYDRKEPAEMLISQVVPGFSEALKHMPVGSTWEVYIPADQGYGEREAGQIKPFSTLIFKIELLEILKNDAPKNGAPMQVMPAQMAPTK